MAQTIVVQPRARGHPGGGDVARAGSPGYSGLSRGDSPYSSQTVPRGGLEDDGRELRDFNGRAMSPWGYQDGLEALLKADRLQIQQQMPTDLKGSCGAGNTYHMNDTDGRRLFYATEDANCFCRWACGPHRLFHVTVFNERDEPVLHLDRSCCRCDWCCCAPCCLCQHTLTVRDNAGHAIGFARQKWHVFQLKMDVRDADQKTFCQVRGPCCPCRCCTEMNFDVVSKDGRYPLGYIFKKWEGFKEPVNMDHESFDIHFPRGLSVSQKASLLGAAFLVNFMYFEMS